MKIAQKRTLDVHKWGFEPAGLVQEVYEKTGLKVSIVNNQLFNVAELKDSNYLIVTGIAFTNKQVTGVERRRKEKSL